MAETSRPDHATPSRALAGRAVELGLLARPILESGNGGTIIAAFQRCFYARIGGHLICVGARTLGSGPLHLLCERWPQDIARAGQPVTVAGSALNIDAAPLVDFSHAPVWQPGPAPDWSLASLTTGIEAAGATGRMTFGGEELMPEQPRPGPPSLLIAAAKPGIEALARIVAHGLRAPASVSADGAEEISALIGLGPGLTPSGDDVLLGALLALDALRLGAARDRLWQHCRPYLDRTNDISRAHLEAAARGYGAATLHAALHATIAGRVVGLDRVLAALRGIGQTSGQDGFTGALVVLHAVRRHLVDAQRC